MKIKAKLITCFSAICIGCMLIAMLCVLGRTRQSFIAMNDSGAETTAVVVRYKYITAVRSICD